MNITMIQDLDTGFLANTLKPAFQALGHQCTVLQTLTTYLESDISHIDFLLKDFKPEDQKPITTIMMETDLFFLRAMSHIVPKALELPKYINNKNTIVKVHGSEMRENKYPYSSLLWRTTLHGKEPYLCAPRDPSLIHLYRPNTISHIERPIRFDVIPRKKIIKEYIVHTPTNIDRKGTKELLALSEHKGTIPLHIVHGVSRKECLRWKAGASYLIDRLGDYHHGPYCMNAVEAWLLRIPVFTSYALIDTVFCPELPNLVHNTTIHSLIDNIRNYEPDKKQLNFAYNYAKRVHDPITIAQQYVALGEHIQEIE